MERATGLSQEIKKRLEPWMIQKGYQFKRFAGFTSGIFFRFMPQVLYLCHIQWEKYGKSRFSLNFGACGLNGIVTFDGKRMFPGEILSLLGASLGKVSAVAFVAVMALSPDVFAEGELRERIRERIKEKKRSQGEVSNNVRQIGSLQEVTLEHDGRTRTYLVHLPKEHIGSGRMPVVLAFHGGGGSSQIMAKDEFYGWISKSNEQGFIVIFPNGSSPFRGGKFATWNAGSCCAYSRDNNVDDVGFIRELIHDAKERFPIDEKRAFATGMSNGGMFSYTLACSMADVFTAIASVTGTDGNAQCNPQKPIAVLHIHAKDDTHVLYNGGAGKDAFKDPSKVTEFVSVPATIDLWVKRNGCEANPRRVLDVDGAYCDLYENCQAGSQVQLCVTETGGHSWPGAKATPRKKSIPPSQVINATDVIWDFFKSQGH